MNSGFASNRRHFPWRALACLAALCVLLPAEASAQRKNAAMVIDANTGEVLHAQSADEPRYPASLTKIMTLYIAFSEIEAGRLSYGTRIRVSEAAASVAPSKLDLDPGSDIALIDAMKALVTKSANDMAVAVAEHIAGSEEAFARMMTARARQIGMRATTFRNASGLPDPAQLTTARDMLTLALRIQDDFPKHYRLFSLKYFSYRGDNFRNHNSLLFHYAGTEGIKTGYTRASGFNLVSSVKREGKHLVAAVFGGETAGTRNAHMRNILTRAFPKASSIKTRRPAPLLIAKPQPAPRPATRPAPQLALKTPPAPAKRPQAPAAAPSPPPVAAPAAPPQAPPVEIAMVKVRPAAAPAIAGRASPAAGSGSEPGTIQHQPFAAAATPVIDLAAFRNRDTPAMERTPAPAPTAPPAPTETILAKTSQTWSGGVRLPGTLDQQLAGLSDVPPDPSRAVRLTAPPAASGERSARGAPPSTLAEQAARLAGRPTLPAQAAPPPPQRLGGPASMFEIQIGTFSNAEEAEARLAAVQSKTASVSGHPAMAIPIQSGGRLAYRARFAGFSSDRATATCNELRRAAIDCFVARPE